MNETKTTQVAKEKIEFIEDLTNKISNAETVLITSIKGLPARQFQKIKKTIRDEADVFVTKKRAIKRAVDKLDDENLKKIKKYVQEDIAFITSKKDIFEIVRKLSKNKSPMGAKAGQIAPNDVEVEAGVTELPAGPAMSELGKLGLVVKVNQGKIEILENKVIVKEGEEISEDAASVMGKLEIMPFSVGFIPKIGYDSKSKTIFEDLTIEPETYAKNMREIFAKANAFAVSMGYICKETIKPLIRKAGLYGKAMEKFVELEKEDKKEENTQEEPKSEENK